MMFNYINLLTFAYVGYRLVRNPQRHLIVLCLCFGTAALSEAIYWTLVNTNKSHHTHYSVAVPIASTATNIFFCVGHWKFVWQFVLGAIDTKNIMWHGIPWQI
jgi:hypothetical protein